MRPLTYARVDEELLDVMARPGRGYYVLVGINLIVLAVGLFAWRYQILTGLGVAGISHPVAWGLYITNFVFWIGIAHSGTLISAILYLFRSRWRTAVHRSAEAMTLAALLTGGLFPLIHLGRPWYFYWLIPYPDRGLLWPNFRSPLLWDVFAIGTYFLVSLLFFFFGLIPDLAAARYRVSGLRRRLYTLFSLGWQGTDREWQHYRAAYLLLAGLATALVVSVHSVVSWDFAVALVPGWHSTLFAPYFVAGAIHSGLAMILTLLVPLRRVLSLHAYLTAHHFEAIAKLLVLTGLILGYAYGAEYFTAWYGRDPVEWESLRYRAVGREAWAFYLMAAFNVGVPLLFCSRSIRMRPALLWSCSLLINVGMWLERFVIITTSLGHEFIPFTWGGYVPTWVEVSITAGGFAWFFLWYLLFVKGVPVISLSEMKEQFWKEASHER
ncbi:MAG: NrfD/PsrC family molybdoenzyme membrane anchor subunit [Candidatus Binatia bacterium]